VPLPPPDGELMINKIPGIKTKFNFAFSKEEILREVAGKSKSGRMNFV
jgi:hypothetical protein